MPHSTPATHIALAACPAAEAYYGGNYILACTPDRNISSILRPGSPCTTAVNMGSCSPPSPPSPPIIPSPSPPSVQGAPACLAFISARSSKPIPAAVSTNSLPVPDACNLLFTATYQYWVFAGINPQPSCWDTGVLSGTVTISTPVPSAVRFSRASGPASGRPAASRQAAHCDLTPVVRAWLVAACVRSWPTPTWRRR